MSEPDFKFELRRLSDRSDQALIAEMQRVAGIITGPITRESFSKVGKVHTTTLGNRFGSWEGALRAAGLEERLHPSNTRLTDEEVIKELQSVAKKLGKTTLTIEDVREHSAVSAERLRRSWSSARKAFEAAGLSATALGKRFNDEERFENLLTVWTHYGRPPQYREMYQPPSKVGGKAYVKRYGSWIAALEAFVERINVGEPSAETEETGTASNTPNQTARGPRDVQLGLRFKVLQRDRFRCVLCGNNPPIDPHCVLHVDHINPWSLGGATELENLRTLCANCNVGRSNRYTEGDQEAQR